VRASFFGFSSVDWTAAAVDDETKKRFVLKRFLSLLIVACVLRLFPDVAEDLRAAERRAKINFEGEKACSRAADSSHLDRNRLKCDLSVLFSHLFLSLFFSTTIPAKQRVQAQAQGHRDSQEKGREEGER